jgi:hypothetical protein
MTSIAASKENSFDKEACPYKFVKGSSELFERAKEQYSPRSMKMSGHPGFKILAVSFRASRDHGKLPM